MNDSTNIRIIADNIRKLFSKSSNFDSRISDLETAAARIPKDYSETETVTGLKWIDGSPIYKKIIIGTFPVITQSTSVGLGQPLVNCTILQSFIVGYDTSGNTHGPLAYSHSESSGLLATRVNEIYSEQTYFAIIEYVKKPPEPTPGNETKKKTTKKG